MSGKEGRMREEERIDSLWLCSLPGIGPASIRKLVRAAGAPREVRKLSEASLDALLGKKRAECVLRGQTGKKREEAARLLELYDKKGILFLPFWDEKYPVRLKMLPDAPAALYAKGRLPEKSAPAAAVIGARECSEYGRKAARYFAAELAKAGVIVVSGMARGVDGIAGWAALEAGGTSVAVLGCGVDICYPPENRKLYVTEAREKSGTLITVDLALEQGKDVFAVPGRITDCCSRGCNRLIAAGAGAALNAGQLLEAMGLAWTEPKSGRGGQKEAESGGERQSLRKRVLKALEEDGGSLDELYERLAADKKAGDVSLQELMQELVLLCMEGTAKSVQGRYFL